MRRGAAAIPVLSVLFQENSNDIYRGGLLSLINEIDGEKSVAARAVAAELKRDSSLWEGKGWVVPGTLLLARERPAEARVFARRALDTKSDSTAFAGLKALAIAGNLQDINFLKKWAEKKNADPRNSVLVDRAMSALSDIEKRVNGKVP